MHHTATPFKLFLLSLCWPTKDYFDNMETNCSLLNGFFAVAQNVAIFMRKLIFNAFGWTELDANDLNKNHLIGTCVCLVPSLINHQCNSTAFWEISNGAVIVISAAR